jgi:hypothetical protein
MRAAAPSRSPFRYAEFNTLRLRLIKIAARVVEGVARGLGVRSRTRESANRSGLVSSPLSLRGRSSSDAAGSIGRSISSAAISDAVRPRGRLCNDFSDRSLGLRLMRRGAPMPRAHESAHPLPRAEDG